MRIFLTSLIVGLSLSGCATVEESPWTDLTVETDPAETALNCGSFPMPTSSDESGITYDADGVNALEAYRVCSEANEGVANEHAAQIDQLKTARKALTEAGEAQRNVAEMRQEMLEDERRHHFWQSLGYWVLIVGAVAL
jgi:hypothetical protein